MPMGFTEYPKHAPLMSFSRAGRIGLGIGLIKQSQLTEWDTPSGALILDLDAGLIGLKIGPADRVDGYTIRQPKQGSEFREIVYAGMRHTPVTVAYSTGQLPAELALLDGLELWAVDLCSYGFMVDGRPWTGKRGQARLL